MGESSSVHICRAIRRVSSSRANRSATGGSGRPIASASAASYPAPIPNRARPPDSTSSVVTAFTSSAGGRNVTAVTSVPSRTRSVRAAR